MQTTLFNPSIVSGLYDDDQSEQDLYDRIVYVIRYYREGHSFHISQRNNVSREEYEDCISFLEALKKLAEDMMTKDQASLLYVRHEDGLELNVTPLYRFLENNKPIIIKNQIRVIKSRIHDYMHSGNFQYVAESYDTMDRLEFFVDQILEDYGYGK